MNVSGISNWMSERGTYLAQAVAAMLTTVLYAVAFPPFNIPEAAFVFLIPVFIWLRFNPSHRSVLLTALGIGWVSWFVLIFWLHHVTWIGLALLSGVVGLHFAGWAGATSWFYRKLPVDGVWGKVGFALVAAALWVVFEHVRGWVLTGFPWLPLAASQWDRPIMLQSATFLGPWGVSFALTLLNVGVAAYLVRIVEYAKSRDKKTFSPEFYLGLGVFVWLTFMLTKDTSGQRREPLFKAAVMQPAVPQDRKWDSDFASEIIKVLERSTQLLKPMSSDVVFWPEAVLPYPIKGGETMTAWIERMANLVEAPIVVGALAKEEEKDEASWYNAVFLVRPEWGVFPQYYAKRHLVPFGEYIPSRSLWPWIETIVPLSGDFFPGEEPRLLGIPLKDRTVSMGTLICYEDVYPNLARSSVQAGAAFLFVATNSSWYGKSGAAAQHMAHSVLRAVENRRVVIRCGNDGWSGWIDEYGNVRGELLDEEGKTWFRGAAAWKVDRDARWKGRTTFYTRHGDWFAYACYGYVGLLGGALALRRHREQVF